MAEHQERQSLVSSEQPDCYRACVGRTLTDHRGATGFVAAASLQLHGACEVHRTALCYRPRWCVARIHACAPPAKGGETGWKELEQSWRFQQRKTGNDGTASNREPPPKACALCRATGLVTCRFCSGTAVLQVGDKILCSLEGGSSCPVCRGTGEVGCRKCNGSGYLAAWLLLDSD
jgi:hypothetical protein